MPYRHTAIEWVAKNYLFDAPKLRMEFLERATTYVFDPIRAESWTKSTLNDYLMELVRQYRNRVRRIALHASRTTCNGYKMSVMGNGICPHCDGQHG